ncbi:MAG TPA: MinD/ParA family protein [Chloroflexota bacterium]|nr:MinD/ParA family protein [Chloroflexota bacterium]
MKDQAEQLRNLASTSWADKTRTAASASNRATRIIAISSGKGGVGKTNVVVNLALAMARQKRRVLILDADLGLANIDVVMGITPRFNLQHVISGEKTIREIVVPSEDGVQIISGGSGLVDLANLTEQQRDLLIASLAELETMADVLLVDTGAGIGANVLQFILAAQELIIVTTPEPTAITDAYSLIKVVSRLSSDVVLKLLVNQVRTAHEAEEIANNIIGVAKRFLHLDVGTYGSLPYDSYLVKAVRRQKPVTLAYPNSPSAFAFGSLAARIWNEELPATPNKPGLLNFFRRIVKPASWDEGRNG